MIARRYGPNGPYYGFLNRIDGSFASFASWRIRFDSGSFIELTVITRPRLVSARGNGLTCRIASVPEAPTATDLLVDLETSVALPPWFW